jgi:hypothetical protein
MPPRRARLKAVQGGSSTPSSTDSTAHLLTSRRSSSSLDASIPNCSVISIRMSSFASAMSASYQSCTVVPSGYPSSNKAERQALRYMVVGKSVSWFVWTQMGAPNNSLLDSLRFADYQHPASTQE